MTVSYWGQWAKPRRGSGDVHVLTRIIERAYNTPQVNLIKELAMEKISFDLYYDYN
ncbi:MAG: hypothetical protein ABID84_01425 [Chloroflexota bacterium]